ncbi:MAG: BamA/TamA family outer membrane protein, partial [Bacteroides sp.]|nr:BamA/TamA family outer membrane protein [Bacteroides sp.]
MGAGANGRIEGKVKFMPIPYLNYDRSMGFALGAVPMLMFNPVAKDTISPSSLVGGVFTYSTNKTWFTMGFGMFFLNENRWRLTTAGGMGNVNFQFYLDGLVGGWIPYNSESKFFMLKVERKIYKKLYGGVSYNFADVISSASDYPIADSVTLNGFGLNLSLDMRDNPHYPRSGSLSEVKYNAFPEFFGNEAQSQKIQISTNHYFSTRQEKDVIAARLYGGFGLGDLAFSQQFIVKNKDIRGYTQGAYRGNNVLALQGEYRWNFSKRWGAIGYAGVATVFDALNESDNWKPLPGVGTGIRFKAFTATNFNVGLDIAAGIDDWGIYFQIGEVF